MEEFLSFIADLDRLQLQGCFASNTPSIRDYMLQNIPMKPSGSLFNAYGYQIDRSGLDLKPGLRLKIERAYFSAAAPGEEAHEEKNYIGVSSSFFTWSRMNRGRFVSKKLAQSDTHLNH